MGTDRRVWQTAWAALGSVLVGLAAAGPLAGQGLSDRQRRQIDSVFAAYDGTGRPGCAVGIGRHGQTLYQRGYGMADLQHGLAITPSSIFHVASVSKQFAAFAVALLAEDGKLSLDDDVRTHVPELPDYGTRITIRHLIHHTSGIRDQWELLGLAGWRYPDDLFTQDDVLRIVRRQQALNFPPGAEYLYSNSGYTLLAIIVQRVSGQSLRAFSEERIFRPLGMTQTHVHDDHAMIVPWRTSAYAQRPGGGWRISTPTFDTHGATSLFTTVGDLLTWQQNFVAATVGSRALLREAETSSLLNDGRPTNYGFGISVERFRGVRATGHGGADAGYRADVVRFPDHGLAIAVLCNFAEATPNLYTRSVAGILLEGQLQPAPLPPARGTATAADLAVAAGVYRRPGTDQVWRLEVRDSALVLANYGVPLAALGPRRFTAFGLVLELVGPEGRPPEGVRMLSGETVIDSLVRVVAWSPSGPALQAMVGDYWSDELGVGYRVVLRDGALWLDRPKHGEAPLSPAFEDAFLAPGLGTVRAIRTGGRVSGLAITGGRVRNVRFVREVGRPARP